MSVLTKQERINRAVDRATRLFNERWGYVYGAKYSDNPMTLSKLDSLRSQNSKVFTNSYYLKSLGTIRTSKGVIDCSGLVCFAHVMKDIGSWSISELPKTNSTEWESYNYKTVTQEAGDILWHEGHVGLAIDSTHCIEARGIEYGVVRTISAERGFKKIIRLKDIPSYRYARIGWIAEPDGRYWYAYDYPTGSYYHDCIEVIDGIAWLFDHDGYVAEGYVYIQTGNRGEVSRGATVIPQKTEAIKFYPTGAKIK